MKKNSKLQTPNSKLIWDLVIGHWKFADGQVMIIAIIFLAVVLILASSLFARVAGFLQFGSNSIIREQATNLAEAGVDFAIWQLNQTAGTYAGPEIDKPLGTTGTFSVTITNKSASIKTVTSTGYIPNATTPRTKRTIKVDVVVSAQTISFRYAIQVGNQGVTMANSSTINGNVHSNANIEGTGPSTIEGDAYAVGTITSPPLVRGNSYPGCVISHPDVCPSTMPTVDYQYWKDAANINNDPVTCSPTCEITSSTAIGPRKYVGNLVIRESGTTVTMNGPIHVTGNFEIKNLSTLKLADSFGSNGSVLIVNGTISVNNNGYFEPTNATPKGYILAVTTSTNSPAVTITNLGATAIFYALEGEAQLANQARVSALVAKKLTMRNQATLNYEQGLASATFSTGPGGSWVIKKGTYRFTANP